MRSAIAAALKTLRRTAGATIVVRAPGGAQTLPFRAALGKTAYDELSAEGIVIRQERRDYLVLTSELVLDGQPVKPEEGWEIDEIDDLTGQATSTYRVLPIADGETWHWTDQFRQGLRIHTKLRPTSGGAAA